MMEARRVLAAFDALAVGDALGMPTDFMTRAEICARFGLVDRLLTPAQSQHHRNLPFASVTDDTEQNLYLYRLYRRKGCVDAAETARQLLLWMEETDACQKGYIGPSSRAALTALQNGTDIELAGRKGTTCGGVMRTPAAVLYAPHRSADDLTRDIHACLLCTHNTGEALEAAGAYGFALAAAVTGADMEEIVQHELLGEQRLMTMAPEINCAPSTAARIRELSQRAGESSVDELLFRLYSVYGTGLPSADVAGAAFGIFFAARGDVWKALRMGASVGGDTDTIAALAGALCAAYAGRTNIPVPVRAAVFEHNPILNGPPWEAQE